MKTCFKCGKTKAMDEFYFMHQPGGVFSSAPPGNAPWRFEAVRGQ